MDDNEPDPPRPDRIVRAGERSLGLIPPQSDEGALQDEIARWDEDFAQLAQQLEPVAPAPGVWTAIAAACWGRPEPRPRARVLSGLWRAAPIWRTVAAIELAAVLALLAVLSRPAPAPPQVAQTHAAAPLIATLADRDGGPVYVVAFDPSAATFAVVPTGAPMRGAVRLWLTPQDALDPVLVGAVPPGDLVKVSAPPALIAQAIAGARLAIVRDDGTDSPGTLLAHGQLAAY